MKQTGAVDRAFDGVVKTTAEQLKKLGFKRKGLIFRLFTDDNCGFVGFQRSTTNTKDRIKFTVNTGVICGELLDVGPSGLLKANIWDAHVHVRIGSLLPEGDDKWWEIVSATDSDNLSQEIPGLILKHAVPYINLYLRTDSIISLWESGRCPGLTDFQRVNHLSRLRARRGAAL
jgi:hypothetical protein